MTAIRSWLQRSVLLRALQALALEGAPLETVWRGSLAGRLRSTLNRWAGSSRSGRWVEPISLVVLCILIFGSAYLPTAASGVLLGAASACALLLFAVGSRLLPPLALPVFVFWLAALVACAGSPRLALSLDGFIKLSLYLGSFALAAPLLQRPLYRTAAIATYLVATLPMSLYGLWQWRTGAVALATWVDPGSPLADTTRVYSFLGNPNLLAGYLLAAIPLGLTGAFLWKSWGARGIALLAALAAGLCLVLTFSRGGWMAMAATLAFFAALLYGRVSRSLAPRWRFWLPVGLLAAVVLVLGALTWTVPVVSDRLLSIFSGRDDSSNNFRINVWAAVFEMIRARPLTGIGPGNRTFEAIYPFFQRPKFNALSAYSIALEIAVEMGILGVLAFGWLAVALLVQGISVWLRPGRPEDALWVAAATSAAVGLLVNGIADTVWFRPPVQVVWWLLAAVVAAGYGGAARERS